MRLKTQNQFLQTGPNWMFRIIRRKKKVCLFNVQLHNISQAECVYFSPCLVCSYYGIRHFETFQDLAGIPAGLMVFNFSFFLQVLGFQVFCQFPAKFVLPIPMPVFMEVKRSYLFSCTFSMFHRSHDLLAIRGSD